MKSLPLRPLNAAMTVRAHVQGSYGPLYRLEAELVQGGQVKATATAKFMAVPDQHRATIAADPRAGSETLHPSRP